MKYTREQLVQMAWAVLTDRTGKGDRVMDEVARRMNLPRAEVVDRIVRLALGS